MERTVGVRNELLTGESKIDKNFRTGMRHEKNFGNNFKFLGSPQAAL